MKSKLIIFVAVVSIFMCSCQSFAKELDITSRGGVSIQNCYNGNYMAWNDMFHKIHVSVTYSNGDSSTVALNETSYYRPSIAYYCGTVTIAWAGTDGRINVMYSTNGLNFTKKWTLEERCLYSPCLMQESSNPMICLAWTGTNKQINYAMICPTEWAGWLTLYGKQTLNETSQYSPALCSDGYNYYLAWTGEDNRINYKISHNCDFTSGIKITKNYKSNNAPTLTPNFDHDGAILGWTQFDLDEVISGQITERNHFITTIRINAQGESSEYTSYHSYFSLYSPSLYTDWINNQCYITWTPSSTLKINVQPIY